MKNIVIILFLVVVGCKNTDDGRYSYKDIDGKEIKFVDGDDLVPPMPDSELNDKTLAGVDSDGDGVRDDVEIWINMEGEKKGIRLALKEAARNLNLAIVNYRDRDQTYKYVLKKNLATGCLADLFGINYRMSFDLVEDLYEEIVNSDERSKAYLKMNEGLSGRAFPINTSTSCEKIGVDHESELVSSVRDHARH